MGILNDYLDGLVDSTWGVLGGVVVALAIVYVGYRCVRWGWWRRIDTPLGRVISPMGWLFVALGMVVCLAAVVTLLGMAGIALK